MNNFEQDLGAAADALQAAGRGLGRLHQEHEVDGAHIDP